MGANPYWNPAALSFYRRALRVRRLLLEPSLRRRFVYNIREMISLFRYPSQVHAFKMATPLPGHAASRNMGAYDRQVAECIRGGHQDLDLIEHILRSEPKLVMQLVHAFHAKKEAHHALEEGEGEGEEGEEAFTLLNQLAQRANESSSCKK